MAIEKHTGPRGPVILETHTMLVCGCTPRLVHKEVSVKHGGYHPQNFDVALQKMHSARGRAPAPRRAPVPSTPREEWADKSSRRPIPTGSWRSYGPRQPETEYTRAFQYSPRGKADAVGMKTEAWSRMAEAQVASAMLARAFGS